MPVLPTGARKAQDAKKCNLKVPSTTLAGTYAGRIVLENSLPHYFSSGKKS